MIRETHVRAVLIALLALSALTADAAPSIDSIAASSGDVGLYQKFELTFAVGTAAENPYWPCDEAPNAGVPAKLGVTVDGLFSNDGWQTTITQPGFIYQEHETSTAGNAAFFPSSGGRLWLYPVGPPCWKIRFAPGRTGQWKYKIRVTDASGTTTSPEGVFNCIAGGSHGFVRVSPTDPRYFELSDGTYVPLTGLSYSAIDYGNMDADYTHIEQMGINLIRSWWQSSSTTLPLFGAGGQGGDTIWVKLRYDTTQQWPGSIGVAKLVSGAQNYDNLYIWVAVKPSTRYRFSATVKMVGSDADPNSSVYLDVWPNGTSERLQGDSDWREVVYDFTTKSDQYVQRATVFFANATTTSAYCAKTSLRECFDGTPSGPELLVRPDFQAHKSFPQSVAWSIDRQLEAAARHGIYVRAVIEEKGDSFYSRIQADGTFGSSGGSGNVYANPTHACRTLQTYYWRYLIARYGYSTALHSVELFNEGDPFNGNHSEATVALGRYFRVNDPNKHLVSTSNWHSFPPAMWRQPEIDNADVHMYLGWGVASGGNRLWPGWDGVWVRPTYNDITDLNAGFHFDTSTSHSGNLSLRMDVPVSSDPMSHQSSAMKFQVGLEQGHQYRVSAWAKAEGCVGWNTTTYYNQTHRCGLYLVFSKGGGDFAGYPAGGDLKAPLGTYDWQQIANTFTVTSPDANILEVTPRYWSNSSLLTSDPGRCWLDDVLVEDLTTGRVLNYNGGFEETDPENYDVVAGHCAYSRLANSYRLGKPSIRGEIGFCYPQRFDKIYKGYTYHGEDQLLVDDIEGVWWRKWAWAHVDPGALYEVYWYSDLLVSRGYTQAKAYQTFMAGIPLSNGGYRDAGAVPSTPTIRVMGQKDVANSRAHLWIDNAPYTWKRVVDQVDVPRVSGTVLLSGLPDGTYQVDWWDTSAGTVTKTEQLTCSDGKIVLHVTDLKSDIACKIQPPPGKIDMRLITSNPTPATGETVTITVEYTNSGKTDALNTALTARVPAQMDYVPGSAEPSGGIYDPQSKSITWTIARVPPAGLGTRTFQAKVQ